MCCGATIHGTLRMARNTTTFEPMESIFYRRTKKSRGLTDLLKWVQKKPRRAVAVSLGFFLGLYVLFNNKGVVTRVSLEMERKEAAEQLQTVEQQTKDLQAQLKALEGDKKTIEKIARERHGMAREGETVYRMKKEN